MKHLILIATFAFAGIILSAQNARFGFTAGPAFSNLKVKFGGEDESGDTKTGITAGVLVNIPAGKSFSFQPELNFVQKGTKQKETYGGVTEKYQITTNYLEVPLNLLFNNNSNAGTFFIGAGPSFSFALSGKTKYDDGTDSYSEDLHFGNDIDNDDLKGLDIGINALTGYRFSNGLLFSAGYNAGLNNLMPGGSSDASIKSHYFSIKLGFLLRNAVKK